MKELKPFIIDKQNGVSGNAEFLKEIEVDILARTIWGEARGEGTIGMQAVAAVILNRFRISQAQQDQDYWWGKTIAEICQKPYQFSVWNEDDPNRDKILRVDEKDIHFATAKRIARRAIYASIEDPAEGATHYHAAGISPFWARNTKPVATIGNHIFYRLVDKKGRGI